MRVPTVLLRVPTLSVLKTETTTGGTSPSLVPGGRQEHKEGVPPTSPSPHPHPRIFLQHPEFECIVGNVEIAESAMRMSLAGFVIVDNFINSTASSENKKTGLKFVSVTDESCCLWRGSNGKLTLRQF